MKNNPERMRSASYNDCWMRHRNNTEWLGFLEIQDFVYSPRGTEHIGEKMLGALRSQGNYVELSSWPMQENPSQRLSNDHVGERDKLSGQLMMQKYQFRRDFPSGKRTFARPSAIGFIDDSKLLEKDATAQLAKSDWEILSFTVERDGFDAVDPHRWKAFANAAEQLAPALAERLQRRRLQ